MKKLLNIEVIDNDLDKSIELVHPSSDIDSSLSLLDAKKVEPEKKRFKTRKSGIHVNQKSPAKIKNQITNLMNKANNINEFLPDNECLMVSHLKIIKVKESKDKEGLIVANKDLKILTTACKSEEFANGMYKVGAKALSNKKEYPSITHTFISSATVNETKRTLSDKIKKTK